MWIKDENGDYIKASEIAGVCVTTSDNVHALLVGCKGDPENYLIRSYHRKEDAEAARDALIRKLGGEVIEV